MSDNSTKATQKPAKPVRSKKIERTQMRYLSNEAVLEELEPSRLNLMAIVMIALLLAASIVWSKLAEIQTSAVTSGEILPTGAESVVQHLEGGIVRAVSVSNGDRVSQGDVLIELEPTARRAEFEQVRARRASLKIREIRLRAFINDDEPDFSDLEQEFPEQVAEAKIALEALRTRIEGQRAVIESRIAQRAKAVDVYKRQVVNLREQRGLVEETVEMRDQLHKSGHGSRVNLINAQLELARVRGGISEAQISADQARAAIEEARSELVELEVTERSNALDELNQVLADASEVRQNLARLEDHVSRLFVRASSDGIVHGLAVSSPGAVVSPGEPLMSIVPDDGEIVAEVRIDPADIGHLEVGQRAKVNVSGFDARRYGTIEGELTRISPTSDMAEDGNTYFRGEVVLDRTEIDGLGQSRPLVPGMLIQADVVTGKQTMLEYLTGPLHAAVSKAFSER